MWWKITGEQPPQRWYTWLWEFNLFTSVESDVWCFLVGVTTRNEITNELITSYDLLPIAWANYIAMATLSYVSTDWLTSVKRAHVNYHFNRALIISLCQLIHISSSQPSGNRIYSSRNNTDSSEQDKSMNWGNTETVTVPKEGEIDGFTSSESIRWHNNSLSMDGFSIHFWWNWKIEMTFLWIGQINLLELMKANQSYAWTAVIPANNFATDNILRNVC